MLAQSEFLSQLQLQSYKAFQRNGVVIYGDADWQNALIADFHQKQQNQTWFCVGEWQLENAHCVNAKQGNMLLGRECDVLLFDARKELDANSFTSALGSLVGGGLLIVVANKNQDADEAKLWMQTQWQQLTVIEENLSLPLLPAFIQAEKAHQFSEQTEAVSFIEKVVTGHRKRPLVLTADRGRGKTSALGIACAQLLEQKLLRILVTAPSIKAVEPVYQHAQRMLSTAERVKKDRLEAGQGYIQSSHRMNYSLLYLSVICYWLMKPPRFRFLCLSRLLSNIIASSFQPPFMVMKVVAVASRLSLLIGYKSKDLE